MCRSLLVALAAFFSSLAIWGGLSGAVWADTGTQYYWVMSSTQSHCGVLPKLAVGVESAEGACGSAFADMSDMSAAGRACGSEWSLERTFPNGFVNTGGKASLSPNLAGSSDYLRVRLYEFIPADGNVWYLRGERDLVRCSQQVECEWGVAADGQCNGPPPPEEVCAAKAGQPGPVLRGNFDGFENDSYTDSDGCEVVPVGEVTCAIPYSEANAQRDYFPPVCSIPSEYTGTYSETGEQSPTQLTAPPPPQATTDSRETTESSVTEPATVTTNPDGSQTTTQKTTKTTVSEAGSTVSAPSPSKSVVVSQEGGKVIVTVTEVASTTHPDGKVVTTTTVTKTITSTPKTTTTVSAPAGQKPTVTVHTTPEATDSGKTKTTVTAYPDGRTETSTEMTGGGGQGADGVSEAPGEGEGDEPLPDGGAAAGDVGFPTLAEAPGFGESLTALSQGIAASPIAQAASSLSGLSDGSGSCNAPSFSVFGETFAFDFHCQLWPQIAPVIEAAALAAWAILAVLILMSA